MTRLDYLHLDVFTDRRFEGNQLAVFLDGRGLDAAAMQTIAREMNFSETTFILPAERPDTDVRMRIFTPGRRAADGGASDDRQHVRAGAHRVDRRRTRPVRVRPGRRADARRAAVEGRRTRRSRGWISDCRSSGRQSCRPMQIMRAVGVDPRRVREHRPCRSKKISCGVPFICCRWRPAPRSMPRTPDMRGAPVDCGARSPAITSACYLFTTEPTEPGVTAYSRMFAAGLGVAEDPATGSACGPLGCYLVQARTRAGRGRDEDRQLAGRRDGPAEPHSHRDHRDAERSITRVQVGGQAVLVGGRTAHHIRFSTFGTPSTLEPSNPGTSYGASRARVHVPSSWRDVEQCDRAGAPAGPARTRSARPRRDSRPTRAGTARVALRSGA